MCSKKPFEFGKGNFTQVLPLEKPFHFWVTWVKGQGHRAFFENHFQAVTRKAISSQAAGGGCSSHFVITLVLTQSLTY